MTPASVSQTRTITINGKLIPWERQGDMSAQARPQTRGVPYHPPPSKRDMRRAIFDAVYESGGAVSCRKIAESLGLKKTTWLEAHVAQLVYDGYLIRTAKPYRPNMPMYFYEVSR